MVYQLTCTLISIILNLILILLIWRRSPPQTGKYRWLMTFTAGFEIFWGAFDLLADVMSHSVGSAVITFRINYPDSSLSAEQSSWLLVVYTAIFGASMAVFASHFVYRYGCIAGGSGGKFTSGWRFSLLFLFPMLYCFWWGTVVRIYLWKDSDLDDYTKDIINETVNLPIENISYVGMRFYNFDQNRTMTFNKDAWIAASQMGFMVGSSMACVFGFGILCYLRLSDSLSLISNTSQNLQKQLFYSLVLQTLIPLVLMHTPITVFFMCPMFNMGADLASTVHIITIALYPAVDPIPSFFIIKSYREAIANALRAVLCLNQGGPQIGVVHNVSLQQQPSIRYMVPEIL